MSSIGNIHGTATLNASQFVSGANQAVGSLKQLELATAANWWGLRNLGTALAAIPAAVAAGVGASVAAYMEWEDAIAGVERTTYRAQTATETAAEANERNAQTLQGIVDGLKEIASSTPVAASTLAGIAESAGALGVAEADIISFTKVVADLDATTDLTANSAGVNLARIAGLTGVAGQGYDNLASSILEVGRSTAATEQEIVDIANRISGIASVANLSAAEVIGFAGAMRSAGIRSEMGGTAFQKTFIDIITAVSTGGEELAKFAAVSGKTSAELQQDFGTNAADAFTDFIAGLGQLNAQGANVIGILNDMGIVEARQTQTLLLLAQAETQVVNENLKLSNSLETSRGAFADGNTLAEIAAKRYQTLSSQIQVLRNEIFLAAAGFGATFAPVIGFVVERLREFIAGMNALPQPLKIVVGVVLGVTVALMGLAAAAILVGPRIVLAVSALRQLGATSGSAVGGLAATSAGMTAVSRSANVMAASTAVATQRLNQMQLASVNAGLATMSARSMTAATGAASLGGGAAQAAAGMSGMTLWASRLGKGLGVLGAVLTVGSILLTVFGNAVQNNQSAMETAVTSNADLFNVLARNNNQLDASTDAWIRQSDMWAGIETGAARYGQTIAEVTALINGSASSDAYQKFLQETNAAYKDGDKGAKEYADNVITLSRTFAETRKEAASILGPINSITDANSDLEDSFNTEDEIRELEKLRRALEDQANAHVDYVTALQAQSRAQFDLLDAQRAYNDALADAQDPTRVLGDLERKLASARRGSEKSQEALAKAERKLSTARENQQEALSDSLEDVIDAQESYSDAQQKLQDAEEELAKLRRGPELKNIVKATNDLRNAQLRLLRANQDVTDAEWQLNYLREEGASARDIEDAELTLMEARQEVANTTQEIAESEEELQAAREGASARELADAEEAVADALRATQKAYDEIIDKEQEVAELRDAIANDTAYRDAERELADARDNVVDATEGVADAERALREARDFGIARNLKEAELDLTDAIFATARANADARIAQLEMNGVYVDAGTKAAILAEELGKLTGLAPTSAQNRRLREYIDILRSAPESGPPREEQAAPEIAIPDINSGEVTLPEMPDLDEFTSGFEEFADEAAGSSLDIWGTAWDAIKPMLGEIIIGALGTALLVFLGVPALAAGLIVGAAWWIANTFGDEIIGFFTDTVGPALNRFFTEQLPSFFTESLPAAFRNTFDAVVEIAKNFFLVTLPGVFNSVVPGAFVDAIKEFGSAGWRMIRGLWNGIEDNLGWFFNQLEGLPGGIVGFFVGAVDWLFDAGWELVTGLWNGLSDNLGNFFDDVGRIPGQVIREIGDTASSLRNKGWNFIVGLWNGMRERLSELWNDMTRIPGNLASALGDIGGWFWDKGTEIVRGIMSGLGYALIGLIEFLWDLPRSLTRVMTNVGAWFWNVGVEIVNGIVDGIYAVGGDIIDVLMGFAQDAWDRVKSWFGIHSPSKKMAWLGQMMMYGLRDGMEDNAKAVTRAATAVAESTMAAFDGMGIDAAMQDLLNTEAARMNVAMGGGPQAVPTATPVSTTIINEGDTFNLEAKTDANATEIVDEFMWAKMVRTG